jgi:hypothetical protein
MEKRGLLPNHVTFSTVICAHARAGNPREAQSYRATAHTVPSLTNPLPTAHCPLTLWAP